MKNLRPGDVVWVTMGHYGWRAARVEFEEDRRGWVSVRFMDPKTGAKRGSGRRRPYQIVYRDRLRFGNDKPTPAQAAAVNQ